MIPFIDIHTHKPTHKEGVLEVMSTFLQDIELSREINSPFSTAIHPWHATGFSVLKVSEMLEKVISQPNLKAIGETGLDKVCSADYQQQKLLFDMHIQFAERYHKPLIIHVVKSWNDLLEHLKEPNIPIILHGYSYRRLELTRLLINKGFYFSLGKKVTFREPDFCEVVRTIPLNALFLETDDTDIPIDQIYEETASILDISSEDLKNQILVNFTKLFGTTPESK